MSATIYFYKQNSKQFDDQYDSFKFEPAHQFWRVCGSSVLGVGSGR